MIYPRIKVDKNRWHSWFAWYPIKYGIHWVWLQRVQRRWCDHPVIKAWDYSVPTIDDMDNYVDWDKLL